MMSSSVPHGAWCDKLCSQRVQILSETGARAWLLVQVDILYMAVLLVIKRYQFYPFLFYSNFLTSTECHLQSMIPIYDLRQTTGTLDKCLS